MLSRRTPFAWAVGSADSIAPRTTSINCQLLHIEANSPCHDSAQIEQIVDELRLRPRIAFDYLHRPLEVLGFRSPLPSQDLRPSQNGTQWRPQFVRQRGQKLVFDARGSLRRYARTALCLEHCFPLHPVCLQGFGAFALG